MDRFTIIAVLSQILFSCVKVMVMGVFDRADIGSSSLPFSKEVHSASGRGGSLWVSHGPWLW